MRLETDKKGRPPSIRAKFSNLKDKNIVLQAGRKYKGKEKISEEFTETDKIARKHLAEFARKQSKTVKYGKTPKHFLHNHFFLVSGPDGHFNKINSSSTEIFTLLTKAMKL